MYCTGDSYYNTHEWKFHKWPFHTETQTKPDCSFLLSCYFRSKRYLSFFQEHLRILSALDLLKPLCTELIVVIQEKCWEISCCAYVKQWGLLFTNKFLFGSILYQPTLNLAWPVCSASHQNLTKFWWWCARWLCGRGHWDYTVISWDKGYLSIPISHPNSQSLTNMNFLAS